MTYQIKKEDNGTFTIHRENGTKIEGLNAQEAYSIVNFEPFVNDLLKKLTDEIEKEIPDRANMFGDEVKEYVHGLMGPLYVRGFHELNKLTGKEGNEDGI